MRFFSRKKESDDEDQTKQAESPISSLGIFTPSIEVTQSDPVREFRRMTELDQIFIRSKKLESLEDVPYIVNQVCNGNIVLLDITKLNDGNEQNHLALKRIIERIRGETRGYNAEIALINDGCMIVTPAFVKF
ncbi:MAG: hypothetical protein BAJATHORv1_20106 [Candidatus Thorarchaeota archaeon]|nr:MAG: hypothetical protein BAJATHORv1_20106 [Candidatus Thorarchaeota archaeon]